MDMERLAKETDTISDVRSKAKKSLTFIKLTFLENEHSNVNLE